MVRRLSPNDRKIELPAHTEDPPRKGFAERPAFVNAKMLAAMGADLAAIHLGTGNHQKAIAKDLRKRGGAWLRRAVAAAAEHVRREQREWTKVARKS